MGGALLLGTVLASGPALAEEGGRPFSVSGFGTLGLTHTTSDAAHFVRDLYAPDGARRQWTPKVDSLLGMQFDYAPSETVSGTVQAVSRYRHDRSYDPEISLAFLRVSPNRQLDLRFGRLGTDFFMLADSRMVGYSYLTVRPSGDFFWHLPFYSINGADATVTFPAGEGALRMKAFAGRTYERMALEDETWKLNGALMQGAYAEWQGGPWQVRASYANIRFRSNLPLRNLLLNAGLDATSAQIVEDDLATRDKRTDYFSLGAVYEHGPWQGQLMANVIEQGNRFFEDSWSVMSLLGYRLGSVTPFVGYSRALSRTRPATDLGPLTPVAARMMAESHVDQHTVSLGARWDVLRDVAFKVQLDGIRGTPTSLLPYRRETASWDGRMKVLSATLDFIF